MASLLLLLSVILPVVAVSGTVTTISVADAEFTTALTPLNFTILFAATLLKLLPVMVTTVFGKPPEGETPVMATETSAGLSPSPDLEQEMINKEEIKTAITHAMALLRFRKFMGLK